MINKNINTKKTNEQFISESKLIHNDKYDYSLVDYKSNKIAVKIICKKHGIFEQIPKSHLFGSGCRKCVQKRSKYTKQEIIQKLKSIYGNNYEYPNFEFNSTRDKITLVCKKHGDITKTIKQHFISGCRKCYFDRIGDTLRSTKEKFIDKSNLVHNYRYNYNLVNYHNNRKNVVIICKEHGEFNQTPQSHLKGNGCPKCKNSKGEVLIENFLSKNNINYYSQFVFNDCKFINPLKFDFYLYDFNICIEFDGNQHYANSKSESYYYDDSIKIKDNIKNEYCIKNNIKLIRIKYHSIKNIDSILSKILKKENVLSMEKKKELFIKKSIELWGYKYDYSKVEYTDYKTPVKIGYKGLWYSQTPNKHLQGKKIEYQETRMSNENFIILSKKIWGEDRFDYSECEYLGTNVKVKLFDKLNNRWIEQVAKSHLKGYEVTKLTKNEFLLKSSIIHDYNYKYDLSNYKNLNSRIKIFCPIHGDFELKASSHIYGSGCKNCDISIFFKEVKKFLNSKNMTHITNYYFNSLSLPFDFYIPSIRTCIEFDGIQHFEPIEYFGGLETYERLKVNDKIKNDYCEENYINLIRIKYDQIDTIEEILKTIIRNK